MEELFQIFHIDLQVAFQDFFMQELLYLFSHRFFFFFFRSSFSWRFLESGFHVVPEAVIVPTEQESADGPRPDETS